MPFVISNNVLPSTITHRRAFHAPRCATKPPKPRSNPKRPRSGGFSASPPPPDPQPETSDAPDTPADSQKAKLRIPDKNGITLEHRLREEILHPLRQPKLTLFGTMTLSATLGLFFAIARVRADPLEHVLKNVLIDAGALSLFGYLTYREIEFGRRALNSIARRVEARDLGIVGYKQGLSVPVLQGKQRLSLLQGDLVIVAGRRGDILKYLGRAVESGDSHPVLAFPTDGVTGGQQQQITGTVAMANPEDVAVWVNWFGEAVPPRRNIALFRLQASDRDISAKDCVVEIGSPLLLPLPTYAKRPQTVDV